MFWTELKATAGVLAFTGKFNNYNITGVNCEIVFSVVVCYIISARFYSGHLDFPGVHCKYGICGMITHFLDRIQILHIKTGQPVIFFCINRPLSVLNR